MPDPERSNLNRYGAAAFAASLATAARLLMQPALGNRQAFAMQLLAVLLTAWHGGPGPSLLALALGAASGSYFLWVVPGPSALPWAADLLGLGLYLAVGSALIAFCGAERSARRRLQAEVAERRLAEGRMRESERRFARFMQHLPGLAWIKDGQGRYVYANDAAERAFGTTRECLYGRTDDEVFPPETAARFRENDRQALGSVAGVQVVEILEYGDGNLHHSLVSKFPIPGPDGGPAIVGGMAIDITDRMRAEAALRSSEERFRGLMEQAPFSVQVLAPDGRTLRVNRAWEELWGLSLEQLADYNMLHDPQLAARGILPFIRRAFDGEAVDVPAIRYDPDESLPDRSRHAEPRRWVSAVAYPLKDGDGEVREVVLVHEDITDRTRAEERVRFQARLLDAVGQSVIATDPAGRVLYWNRAARTLYGWEEAEAMGRGIMDLIGAPGTEAQGAEVMARMRAGETWSGEFLVRRRDGTVFPAFVTDTPFIGEGGSLDGIIGVSVDITERKRAEEATRRSEERFRMIVESATDYAIFTMSLDGKITSWNSGARNLLGYDEAEIVGRDSGTMFIPVDVERGVPGQEIAKALERGRAENERWHVRKDGTQFWASGLVMPMRDGGAAVGLLKIMRDTTEQKRTEQELEVSRERLDLVVNSSEVGFWYCDLPFDVLGWNPKCKEHFGLPPDAEVTIDTFFERIHPDDREETRRLIERSIECRAEYDAEFRTVDPQGGVRWVRAIGQPFFDRQGLPMRFDGITVDVTGRIRQEEALREADRRKDEFLATLAHELRNPLAPIRNALHLMARPEGPGPDFEEERAMAERQVGHLARLVDDLMDVARISRGKIELRKQSVDVAVVVGQAVQTARPLIDERRHSLTVKLPEGPVRLEADPTRLEQVLWNLLNNAAKYSDPGGRIDLGVEVSGGEVVIRVRDAGIGIAPAMLPKVFEMFAQVDHRSDRAQGGLGIGLGLVKSLVELHGGTIEASSEGPDRGSEFVVRLPATSAASPEKARPRRGPGAGSQLPRLRVLVVDDNVDSANSMARLLGRLHEQEVRVAYDGQAALEIAEEFRPELVLLDIGLPGMSGHEVARRLRGIAATAGSLLVALTGWGQEEDRRRSTEAGFDRHFVKPVDPEVILGLIAGLSAEGDRPKSELPS